MRRPQGSHHGTVTEQVTPLTGLVNGSDASITTQL
jgi:hypothetical protein